MRKPYNSKISIMFVAGEASGDLHGAALIKALLKKRKDITCFGFGGSRMKQAGMDLIIDLSQKSVIGFVEVLKHWGFFKRSFDTAVMLLKQKKPDLLVLIDYPGFNLRLAEQANKMGIKVCYYISPQVWAWKAGRLKKMRKFIDKMLVILPFEKQIYDQKGIECVFVGNPLMDSVLPSLSVAEYKKQVGWKDNTTMIGILPGSRLQEITNLLPVMLETAILINKKLDNSKFIIVKAPHLKVTLYESILNKMDIKNKLSFKLIDEYDNKMAYTIRSCFDVAMVASGTATLETAILKTPFVILYQVHPITYFIGKQLINIDMIGLVNIIAGKKIVPEYIQDNLKPAKIAMNILLLIDGNERIKQISALSSISKKLGNLGIADKAAIEVLRTGYF